MRRKKNRKSHFLVNRKCAMPCVLLRVVLFKYNIRSFFQLMQFSRRKNCATVICYNKMRGTAFMEKFLSKKGCYCVRLTFLYILKFNSFLAYCTYPLNYRYWRDIFLKNSFPIISALLALH